MTLTTCRQQHAVSSPRQAPHATTVTKIPPPRLYTRQRRLLALLCALGGDVENLDFQKLLFLHCQELESSDSPIASESLYQFIPYQYGAFSFTSYADRRRLVARAILADHDRRWTLTDLGRQIASSEKASLPTAFASRYRHLRGNRLIAETYQRYPYYATRSRIAATVLKDDPSAIDRIAMVRPKASDPGLFTIGYQNRTLESYLNSLLRASVTLLCDVRKNAISRKYGFSKTTLSRACEGVGIRYEHLPELGIASTLRRQVKSESDLTSLFRTYREQALPENSGVLQLIYGWLKSSVSVALTCYERDPHLCHRHCVADALGGTTLFPKSSTPPAQQRRRTQQSFATHL